MNAVALVGIDFGKHRFFCLLFFALGGNPTSKKSESPEGSET